MIEEKLKEILKTVKKPLYKRKGDNIEFHPSLNGKDFLHFAFKGTRENQLFLTNSVNQKVDDFKPIYDWFKNNLILIAPDSRFGPFEQFIQEDHPLYGTMNNMLPLLDTGIEYIGGENMSFDHRWRRY